MLWQKIVGTAGYLGRSTFARQVATLQIGSISVMAIGFLKSVVFARMLGLSGWGEYTVVLVFVGTLTTVINLGQNQAALTFFAEAYSLKDHARMRQIIKYYVVLSIFAIAIVCALMAAAPLLTDWMYGTRSTGETARIALLAVIVGSFDGLFLIFLQVTRRIAKMTMFENANLLLQTCLSLALLYAGFGIPGIFWGGIVGNVIMLGAYVWDYFPLRREYGFPGVMESLRSDATIAPPFWQGLWIALDKNMGKLFPQGFLFVMSLFTTKEIVGLAQLAMKIAALPGSFFLPHVGRMASTMLPAIRAEGPAMLRKRCISILKHSVAVHGAATLGGMVVLPYLAVVLYGDEYATLRWPIVWLTAVLGISALNVLNSPYLRLERKTYLSAIWNGVSLPLEFILLAGLMHVIDPLASFVVIIAFNLIASLWLNAYIFTRLLRKPKA